MPGAQRVEGEAVVMEGHMSNHETQRTAASHIAGALATLPRSEWDAAINAARFVAAKSVPPDEDEDRRFIVTIPDEARPRLHAAMASMRTERDGSRCDKCGHDAHRNGPCASAWCRGKRCGEVPK